MLASTPVAASTSARSCCCEAPGGTSTAAAPQTARTSTRTAPAPPGGSGSVAGGGSAGPGAPPCPAAAHRSTPSNHAKNSSRETAGASGSEHTRSSWHAMATKAGSNPTLSQRLVRQSCKSALARQPAASRQSLSKQAPAIARVVAAFSSSSRAGRGSQDGPSGHMVAAESPLPRRSSGGARSWLMSPAARSSSLKPARGPPRQAGSPASPAAAVGAARARCPPAPRPERTSKSVGFWTSAAAKCGANCSFVRSTLHDSACGQRAGRRPRSSGAQGAGGGTMAARP
mmetsp:Transcript_86724/g.269855  ORF Transcript_86724/g.269855 Transcript_86724/m.269855 type:complete len:286 (+) Transcript_86724:208-1065(+)